MPTAAEEAWEVKSVRESRIYRMRKANEREEWILVMIQ
jgi:hypothetical protein